MEYLSNLCSESRMTKKEFKVMIPIGHYTVGKVAQYEMYHLFPCYDTTQEKHFAPFVSALQEKKQKENIWLKNIPQKDGSQFKAVWSRSRNIYDIASRFSQVSSCPIYTPAGYYVEDTAGVLLSAYGDIINKIKEGYVEYILYWTHTFLNGKRGIPVLIDHPAKSVHVLNELFPDLITKDGFGVLYDVPEEVALSPSGLLANVKSKTLPNDEYDPYGLVSLEQHFEHYKNYPRVYPKVIRYYSSVRMCAECGVVSDHGEALEKPWQERKRELNRVL